MDLAPKHLFSFAIYDTIHHDLAPPQSYTNTFTSLPVEMKQAILSSAPDVASLKSLVSSCFCFYHCFCGAESSILHNILRRQFGPDLMPLAAIVSESYRLRPWTKEGALDVLSQLFEHRAPASWTLPGASYVSQLHGHVEFFVADFVATKLSNETQTKPSESEVHRIRRTFYLFELYCNLFRARPSKKNRFSKDDLRDLFFKMFAPWENEQLSCIHDYLFEQLSVAHDVTWAEWSVEYDDYYPIDSNPYKEHYLSQGLEYLHKVATATDYDKRFDLLDPIFGADVCFLFAGLTTQDETDGLYNPLEDCTQEEWDCFVCKPCFVDDESGPMEARIWAHAESTRARFYCREEQYALRLRGYIMWDYSRICQWDCFRCPFSESMDDVEDEEDEGDEESDRRVEAMLESWRRRSEVHRRGGRGWWSPDDESKIKWPPLVVVENEPDRTFARRGQYIKEMKRGGLRSRNSCEA